MARIILVDDDEIVANIVQDALFAAGHAVGWLRDGKSAIDVIQRRTPDLLILDCNMPIMSGIDVLRFLRRSMNLYELPVLMLTGRRSETDEQIVRYEGANDYVRKPFDEAVLVGRAEALLNGSRPWN